MLSVRILRPASAAPALIAASSRDRGDPFSAAPKRRRCFRLSSLARGLARPLHALGARPGV